MKKDLTKGNILPILWKLALPIMGTSLLNMTYNMTDMFWLGRLGSNAVASVGTATFYIALGFAILAMSFIGGGIVVAHRLGEKNDSEARISGENALILSGVISLVYIIAVYITKVYLIGFFDLKVEVTNGAIDYLNITIWSVLLTSLTLTASRIMNSYGNSKVPFYISSIGLVLNIILDPLFIFYFSLGIKGAAIATILSKLIIVFMILGYLVKKYTFFTKKVDVRPDIMKKLIKLGYPVTIQRTLFTGVSIFLGKIVATWGADAVAGQRIALQIESISFMTAGGFQGALASFVGQNYGAKKYERIDKGYFNGLGIILSVALVVTLIFFFQGEALVKLFIKEPEVIEVGKGYLRIIAFSQLFMAIEMTTVGAFQGVGRTMPPSVTSIIFTLMRIPLALLLIQYIQVDGVWWSISISSIVKGIVLFIWFRVALRDITSRIIKADAD